MDVLRTAIYDALVADVNITGNLAAYRGTYAIVDGFSEPLDMEVPLIRYSIVSDIDQGTKNANMRRIVVELEVITSVFDDPTTIAEYVRALFHRSSITVSGWTNIITNVQGPVEGRNDDQIKSSLLQIEFTLA